MGIFIIAEAGVNHNGNIELAEKLIDAAYEAGCDAVKFQSFKTDKLVTKAARKAEYQIKNTGDSDSQFDMLKKLELSLDDHKRLFDYCNKKGIVFLSSPFDEESADLLDMLKIEIFKIPSGEITNKPLLKHIAVKGKPIVLSTGMCTLGEVEEAIYWIYEEGNTDITLLHCTSSYLTPVAGVNLRAMLTMKDAFKLKVGYSDHTQGIDIPCAAAALGAEVIEKHFTLDKNAEGPDHKASLNPEELKRMVEAIRSIEAALGSGIKKPEDYELNSREVGRKSVVATQNIKKGQIISREMLAVKRPGTGLQPKYIDSIVGKAAVSDIEADTMLKLGDFM